MRTIVPTQEIVHGLFQVAKKVIYLKPSSMRRFTQERFSPT
jgi:hypothetical protein